MRKCFKCKFPYNASEKKPCENCGQKNWHFADAEEAYYSDPDYLLLLKDPKKWSEDFRYRQGW